MIHHGNLTITTANAAKYADLTEVTGSLYIGADAKLDALTTVGGDLGDQLEHAAVDSPVGALAYFEGDPLQFKLFPLFGQFGGVAAPVVEPAADHGGDGGVQHRLAPGDGPGRDLRRLAAPLLALGQPPHVSDAIAAAARVGGIGTGLDPAPADIGVQRLRPDPQSLHRFFRRQPVALHRFTLIILIKIDDIMIRADLSPRKMERKGVPDV